MVIDATRYGCFFYTCGFLKWFIFGYSIENVYLCIWMKGTSDYL